MNALKALAKDEGTGLGLLTDLLWGQQVGQQVGQQGQQQDDLWRQVHALTITLVKQWTPGCFSSAEHMTLDHLMDLAANIAMVKKTSLTLGPGGAEVRTVTAPWLALFGRCLHLTGVHLVTVQQTAAHHAARARRGSSDQAAEADKKVGEAVADAHRTVMNARQLLVGVEVLQGFWTESNCSAPSSSSSNGQGAVLYAAATAAGTAAEQPAAGCFYSSVDFDVSDTLSSASQVSCAGNLTMAAMCWQAAGGAPGEGLSMRHKEVQAVVGSELIQKLAAQLQLLGAQLCAKLPVSWCCNNPAASTWLAPVSCSWWAARAACAAAARWQGTRDGLCLCGARQRHVRKGTVCTHSALATT
jgi:hypothetical protein